MNRRPRAVVVVTGSELVRGARRDANGPFLAAELSHLGVEPARVVVVGDRLEELTAALHEAVRADVCLVTGGLGPTHDDRTVEVLAAATGRRLVVDERLAGEIERISRSIADRVGRPYADFAAGVRKQASLPEGAVALGIAGTAPAVLVEHEGRVAVALPGPPAELRALWPRAAEHAAFRSVVERAPPTARRVLRFFAPSESAVAKVLHEADGEGEGVEVTVCAHDLEVEVELRSAPGGEGRAARLEQALRDAFPRELFAEDDERTVAELVLGLCRARGLTLATAESSTGGLVAARLTDVAGASDVFLGAVVAYSDKAKRRQLGVAPDVLRQHGAVSAETAVAMAVGARQTLGADVAVAVTGIAGPSGGTPAKPVGLVYVAVDAPDGGSTETFVLPGDREAVRARAAAIALHLVRRSLATGGRTRA